MHRSPDGAEVGSAIANVVYVIGGRVVTPARALEAEGHEELVGYVLPGQVDVELLPLAALVGQVRHVEPVYRTHIHVTIGKVDVAKLELVCLVVSQIVAPDPEREHLGCRVGEVERRCDKHHLAVFLVAFEHVAVVSSDLCGALSGPLILCRELIAPPCTLALHGQVLPSADRQRLVLGHSVELLIEQFYGVGSVERQVVALFAGFGLGAFYGLALELHAHGVYGEAVYHNLVLIVADGFRGESNLHFGLSVFH